MELVQTTIEGIIIALGNTYPIKEELKDNGYTWNAANKVWYRRGRMIEEHIESWLALQKNYLKPDVYYRFFERRENTWAEIQC